MSLRVGHSRSRAIISGDTTVVSAVLVEIHVCRHNTEARLYLSSLIYATKLQRANNCVQSLGA